MKRILCCSVLLALPVPVFAGVGNWVSLGDNVSVRIEGPLMDGDDTWEFRNDGAATITYMDFYYTDKNGTHEDWLPFPLKPGDVFGGWAAFTCTPISASQSVTIRIKGIKYANSIGTPNDASAATQQGSSSQNSSVQSALQQQQQLLQQQQQAAQARQQQLQQQQAALQQQIADKQAELQAKREELNARQQQAVDAYNAAVQRSQAMQNTIQNATDQIIDILQQRQAEEDARQAKEAMEEQQAEADREQRDLQNQIDQLQQQAADAQSQNQNNQNVQNNYSAPPVYTPAAPPPPEPAHPLVNLSSFFPDTAASAQKPAASSDLSWITDGTKKSDSDISWITDDHAKPAGTNSASSPDIMKQLNDVLY